MVSTLSSPPCAAGGTWVNSMEDVASRPCDLQPFRITQSATSSICSRMLVSLAGGFTPAPTFIDRNPFTKPPKCSSNLITFAPRGKASCQEARIPLKRHRVTSHRSNQAFGETNLTKSREFPGDRNLPFLADPFFLTSCDWRAGCIS
jgi:hypothetical protein